MTMIEKIAAGTLVVIILVVIVQLFSSGGEGSREPDQELSSTRSEEVTTPGWQGDAPEDPSLKPRLAEVDLGAGPAGGAAPKQEPGERDQDKPTQPAPKSEEQALAWESYTVQRGDSWARIFERRYDGRYLSATYNLWHKTVVSEARNVELLKGRDDLRAGQSLWLPSKATFTPLATAQLGQPKGASGPEVASGPKPKAGDSSETPAPREVAKGSGQKAKPAPRRSTTDVMGGLDDVRITGFLGGNTRKTSSEAPSSEQIHVVAPNESPATISRKHFNTERYAQEIMDLNGIKDPKTLRIGQRLKLPNR